jgi:hypothetical protein
VLVQSAQAFHLFLAELEIEDLDVFPKVPSGARFRNRVRPQLDAPADEYLSRRLAVMAANLCQRRVVESLAL